MKHTLLLICVAFSLSMIGQSGSTSRSLKPTNYQKRVSHISSEKKRSYYSLNPEIPSLISVSGPGKLRVLTRGRFTAEAGDEISYKVTYRVDGGEMMNVKMTSVEPAPETSYVNTSLGKPGQLEDFEIDLGRGNHSIEFFISGGKIPVAARYIFTKGKVKKQSWIAFSPLAPSEPVDLITRESTINYYRFSTEKPLIVEVNGPTELRVLSRIENHYHMKGRINYRLQVKEDKKVINTYLLSSRRSEVTVYKDEKELIPGKACEFVISIPKGFQRYEIWLLDEGKSTVLGRMLLPEKDVKLSH